MMILFFDIWGIVYVLWVHEGQPVNQHYYIEVLMTLHERMKRKKDPICGRFTMTTHRHILHCLEGVFCKKRNYCVGTFTILAQSCSLWFYFPRSNWHLKGAKFKSVEAVKAKAIEILNQLTELEFHHCFQRWKSCMERCKDHQGEYIEGKKVATAIGNELKVLTTVWLFNSHTSYVRFRLKALWCSFLAF